MVSSSVTKDPVVLNRALLAGGLVSITIGSLLVAVGVLLGGTALLGGVRQWVRQLDRPPQETARLRFHQLRHAATAGAEAWQSWTPASAGAMHPRGGSLSRARTAQSPNATEPTPAVTP